MINFSRRAFLMTGTGALLSLHARAEALSLSAAAFVDSVGVNIHLSSEPYASRFGLVRELLSSIAIKHVRDELRPVNDLNRWRSLFVQNKIRSRRPQSISSGFS